MLRLGARFTLRLFTAPSPSSTISSLSLPNSAARINAISISQ